MPGAFHGVGGGPGRTATCLGNQWLGASHRAETVHCVSLCIFDGVSPGRQRARPDDLISTCSELRPVTSIPLRRGGGGGLGLVPGSLATTAKTGRAFRPAATSTIHFLTMCCSSSMSARPVG